MNTYLTEINAQSLLKNLEDQMVLKELSTIVAPLSKIDEDYPKRVLNYILTADDPQILLDLQNRTDNKAGTLVKFPGSVSYWWSGYDLTTKEQRLATQSQNARNKLYLRLFKALHNDQIVRYGKFLSAVTKKENHIDFAPLSPDWFTYLVVDGLNTSLSSMNSSHRNASKHRSNWRHSHLIEILQSEEIDSPYQVLVNLLFERQHIDDWHRDNLNMLYQLPDTSEILNHDEVDLASMILGLTAKGKMQFIDELPKYHKSIIQQYPDVVANLASGASKTVRERSNHQINQLFNTPELQEAIHANLCALLTTGNASQRRIIVDILARDESNRERLEQALANEKQKSVIQTIESALSRMQSLEQATEVDYTSPAFTPIVAKKIPDNFADVLVQNYDTLLEKKRILADNEAKEESTYGYKWARRHYKEFNKIDIDKISKKLVQALNGEEKPYIFNNNNYIEFLDYKKSLRNLPEFGLHQACRVMTAGNNGHIWWYRLFELIPAEEMPNIELRHLMQVLEECDVKDAKDKITTAYLEDGYYNDLPNYISQPEQIVPFFVEHIDSLSKAFNVGLYAGAMDVLAKFPDVPKVFISQLLELALGEAKTLRRQAQQLLSKQPNIHERAIEALSDGKQAIRVSAVEWLARLNKHDESHKAEITKALYALLKKEKKEIVVASILTTLETMGEDISKYLSPTALLKEAEKGLKGKILKSFQWFDLDSLNTLKLKWQNGKKVNIKIIQWWVVLAEKLKDPNPNGLLQRYISLLDDKSQQALSLFVLQSFIHEDTRNPTLAEATEIANREAPSRLQMYQDWYKRYPDWHQEYANITLEQVVEKLKNEHLSIYLGSAIKSKGMLALAYHSDGSTAVKILQDFMKRHYRRNAQIIALLTAMSASDDPLIIQLLLGLSRRYRTRSVQDLAKELVSKIAERNHWTADQLADRTIPTAGLDETGLLTLDYGYRKFTAYVDDKDKFVLQNAEGKVIKSLPAPRKNDDDEAKALIKESKSLFSNSKKELKQVLSLQTARLYEAMCSERVWTSSDWQEYLFAHPIMKRLITRLVWLEVDEAGQLLRSFRPSEDGSLLDLDDEEIQLADNTLVKLAHSVLLSAEEGEQWQEHLSDYEIKPLFGGSGAKDKITQFTNQMPTLTKENLADNSIDTFKGYLTDTFTLRGVLTKMGYQRASIEDAGSFDRYYKNYDSLGMSAVIVFSGSYVPEENLPAVVYELCFEKSKSANTWNSDYVALDEVNPILLAESYGEYKKLADATSGYDAEWAKKTPW